MAELPHRIRRLRWHASTPSAESALGMLAMLRELMPDVEAALQQAFDAQDLEKAVRYLERLEVRLRLPAKVTPQALMQELGSALGQALQQTASETQPLPQAIPARIAEVDDHRGALPFGDRGALLCALLSLRQHAPQRLQECLTIALRDLRDGWASLSLDGRQWRVEAAALAHWQRWLAASVSPGKLDTVGGPGGMVAIGRSDTGSDGAHRAPPKSAQEDSTLDVSFIHAHRQTPGALASAPHLGGTPATTLPHLQAQLTHYLRTGQIDWMLSGLPADQARQQLREAAVYWAELAMLPDAWAEGAPLPVRLGALCRWLGLLNEWQRQEVIQGHGLEQVRATRASEAGLAVQTGFLSIRNALINLMRDLASSSSDHLHALALWLDWQQAGGEAMADAAVQAWGKSALTWMESWAEQGPVHTAWLACRQKIGASLNAGMLSPGVTTSVPEGTQIPAGSGQGLLGVCVPTEARAPIGSTPGMAIGTSPLSMAVTTQDADGIRPASRPIREPVISQGHLIAQAGLVLLHPYLANCFNVLGLYPTSQRGPIADALWPRAASVLRWLAIGDATEALECDLGLIKLLLGRGERDALSHGLPTLLPHERAEAAAMLQAVLYHWPALKGTSVEGLRESFLQRPGWIEPLDRAWQLRVQPAAFDVLLGNLPWGLSIVKLPWMDRPMHVEWRSS